MNLITDKPPGFHLIELLIGIAIIGIMLGFSLPVYSQYIVKVRRLEAAAILSQLAIAMEQYQLLHQTNQDVSLATLHFPELIVKNQYRLIIEITGDTDYLLVAEPLNDQAQKDKTCAALTLNSNGEKGQRGSGEARDCW